MDQKEILDEQIDGTPFRWRDALLQGSTGIVAVPTAQQHDNIVKQAHAISIVFSMLGGFKITSWLRTPEHNKAIGGATKSAHLTGLATDFVPTHMTVEEAKKKIQDLSIYPGGGEIDSTTWIHLDLIHPKWFYAKPPKVV